MTMSAMGIADEEVRKEVQDNTEQCALDIFRSFSITESMELDDITLPVALDLQRLITDAHWRINAVTRELKREDKKQGQRR